MAKYKTIDQCLEEIFRSVKPMTLSMRLNKTRHKAGKLSELSKQRILSKHGYKKSKDAMYSKVEEPVKDVRKEQEED